LKLIAGTGSNGALVPDAESVAGSAANRGSAYKSFSRLVPDRQEMLDNMPLIAGLAAFFHAADSALAGC
jgi:hypothetical protein